MMVFQDRVPLLISTETGATKTSTTTETASLSKNQNDLN